MSRPPTGITIKRWARMLGAMDRETRNLGFSEGIAIGKRLAGEFIIMSRTLNSGLALAMDSEPGLIASSPGLIETAPEKGKRRVKRS